MEFPIFKTKVKGVGGKFDLTDRADRKRYFQAKAGEEIKKIKKYLAQNSFIGYMLAKKQAGKGTYARMLLEIFGENRIAHLSVGDLVRKVDQEITNPKKKKKLEAFLQQNYRGFHSIEEIIKSQKSRSTQKLLPSEFILVLIERAISRMGKKAILIDGFPRDLDQVSYSLFYRALVGYRDDPDFFVLIQIPESVIDMRMKTRVVCPKCKTPRSPELLPTKDVGYDEKKDQFFLRCDNPACQGARMAGKEGDQLGIEAVRGRMEKDEGLIKQALSLHGIPKILLRNSVPVKEAKKYIDEYEATPFYSYSRDKKTEKVLVHEKPWVVKDDQGVPSYSLLAPAVVLSLIKQLPEVLGI